jgi:hypothetical protein
VCSVVDIAEHLALAAWPVFPLKRAKFRVVFCAKKAQISLYISFDYKNFVNFGGSATKFTQISRNIQHPPGGLKKGTRKKSWKWGFSNYRDPGAI